MVKNIPIYGSGQNIRDWMYVKDHRIGIYLALVRGTIGETYIFGSDNEISESFRLQNKSALC